MVPVDKTQVFVLLILFALNFAVGIALALKEGNFQAAKLADILTKRVVPLGVGYGFMAYIAGAFPDFAVAQGITFAGIVAAMVGHIYKQAQELLGLPNVPLLKG